MNTKRSPRALLIVLMSITIQIFQSNVQAAEIDFIQDVRNTDIEFTLTVDKVTKLAGLKGICNIPTSNLDVCRQHQIKTYLFVHACGK